MQVFINDVPSSCSADHDGDDATSCQFEWLEAETPKVERVRYHSGTDGKVQYLDGIDMLGKDERFYYIVFGKNKIFSNLV